MNKNQTIELRIKPTMSNKDGYLKLPESRSALFLTNYGAMFMRTVAVNLMDCYTPDHITLVPLGVDSVEAGRVNPPVMVRPIQLGTTIKDYINAIKTVVNTVSMFDSMVVVLAVYDEFHYNDIGRFIEGLNILLSATDTNPNLCILAAIDPKYLTKDEYIDNVHHFEYIYTWNVKDGIVSVNGYLSRDFLNYSIQRSESAGKNIDSFVTQKDFDRITNNVRDKVSDGRFKYPVKCSVGVIPPFAYSGALEMYKQNTSHLPVQIPTGGWGNGFISLETLNCDSPTLIVAGKSGSGIGSLRDMIVLSILYHQFVPAGNVHVIDMVGDMGWFLEQSTIEILRLLSDNVLKVVLQGIINTVNSKSEEPEVYIFNGIRDICRNQELYGLFKTAIHRINSSKLPIYLIAFDSVICYTGKLEKGLFSESIAVNLPGKRIHDLFDVEEFYDQVWYLSSGLCTSSPWVPNVIPFGYMSESSKLSTLSCIDHFLQMRGKEKIHHLSTLEISVESVKKVVIHQRSKEDLELYLPELVRYVTCDGNRSVGTLVDMCDKQLYFKNLKGNSWSISMRDITSITPIIDK